MRKLIRKILPPFIISLIKEYRYKKRNSKFKGKTPEETFKEIYVTNHWGSNQSISGKGSTEEQTNKIVKELDALIHDMQFTSILDIPCGDFNWMKKINLSSINYTGADIVDELIINNNENYGSNKNLKFIKLNLINDTLPSADVIINRDCLVHFSFADIHRSLKNIKASGAKYLLTTTFTERTHNHNIITGEWRTLNLQIAPFNFPKPTLIINESCTEGNGKYSDKSLGLWKIEDIKIPKKVYKEI